MSLNLDALTETMEKLLKDIIVKEKICSLEDLKEELEMKNNLIGEFIYVLSKNNNGKITKKLLGDFTKIKADFNELYQNFDDKLMIFIIGNGNVGKSTLLNSLVGYEIAKTNFLPNTWKIDVYSPELNKDKATIKYLDGRKESLAIEEVKRITSVEEKKSKDSKKIYNENLKKELKNLKIKEERDEIKKYLGEKYLYKSLISEVRWPVKRNWILEKCLLVDTPGLNQNLYDLNQLGNINDYYHKADGVLWLLDGQTIAASNTEVIFDELNDVLKNIGGVRNNIIGVINRMDLVRKNGGQESVDKVLNDTKRIFGKKFYSIVDISAQEAFNGIKNNDLESIKNSGILNLQNLIRDIFMSKSETIKNSAKIQGYNKLVDNTLNKLKKYSREINKYENIYIEKNEKLITLSENLKDKFKEDIDRFFENYLSEVEERVDLNINKLSDGEGPNFVKEHIYKLDEFIINRDEFINYKQLEVENSSYTWEKLSKISEYKYIKVNKLLDNQNVVVNIKVNLDNLNNIGYFKPSRQGDLFSILGNMFGKGMFFFRKNSIKRKINYIIMKDCNEMREDIINQLDNNIDMILDQCKEILDKSFSNILFDFEIIDDIKSQIEDFNIKINQQKENVKLKEIIF